METLPFISVVIPVYNEERFIGETLGQLVRQDYPETSYEILVCDGGSTDGTRETVREIAVAHPVVKLLDNPGKRSSSGRNVGFKSGRGEYFVVIDGHCDIPSATLLRDIAAAFEKSGADALGRAQPLAPEGISSFQWAVALARAARIGHGGDSLIYSDHAGFISPVSNGAMYRRRVFDVVGFVDERFDACEDVEFNYRVEQAGLTAYMSPELTVRYYPRESFGGLYRQMRRYGEGRCRLWRKHPETLSLNTLVPPVFAGAVLAACCLVAAVLFGLLPAWALWPFAVAFGGYAVLIVAQTAATCRKEGWRNAFYLPGIFFVIHFGLGMGFVREFLRGCGREPTVPEKVVFVADRIVNPFSGTEKQLVDLIFSLDRARYEPLLCTLDPTPWSEEFGGCPTFSPRIRTLKRPEGWLGYVRLVRWLRQQRPAVVHAYLRDASYLGVTAARLAGVWAIVSSRRGDHRWEGWGPRLFIRQVNRIPRLFVANSGLVAEATVAKEGADASRVRVIPNAIDPERFRLAEQEDRVACRESLGIPANSHAVVAVANIRPVKRLDLLVEALPQILAAVPNTVVHLVGDGIGTGGLKDLVADRGLESSVVFWGSRSDVPRILRAMDGAVLCSDFESQPSAVLEYMASGLPVACSDVGNCAELVESGKTGYIFQPGDVQALAESVIRMARGEYDSKAIAARRESLFAEQNPERITERYMTLYDELLRPRSV